MTPRPHPHPAQGGAAIAEALDALPYAVAMLDADGRVVGGNVPLITLCGEACVGRNLADVARPTAEETAPSLTDLPDDTLVVLHGGRRAWLTTRPMPGGRHVACLRGIEPDAAPTGPQPPKPLLLQVLGRSSVRRGGETVDGPWLEHQPGRLLRVLVAGRGRTLSVDEIADALAADADARSAATVRYLVHTLRGHLEPRRGRRERSQYVAALRGGYRLDTDAVTVDADLFERAARDGLAAHAAGGAELAGRLLERAVARYAGDFLADEPYAEWAMDEREQLRELLARCLRALADLAAARGDLAGAADRLARLAELEPLDTDVQRALIELCLRRGRRGEAARRYAAFERRMLSAYGEPPDFTLRSLSASRAISR